MSKFITFDVMLKGRFVATLRMPVSMADYLRNGKPVVMDTTFKRFVESKLPTLKNKPYNICF